MSLLHIHEISEVRYLLGLTDPVVGAESVVYDGSSRVSVHNKWQDVAMTKRVSRETYAYTGAGLVNTITSDFYTEDGVTIARTTVDTVAYNGDNTVNMETIP